MIVKNDEDEATPPIRKFSRKNAYAEMSAAEISPDDHPEKGAGSFPLSHDIRCAARRSGCDGDGQGNAPAAQNRRFVPGRN